MQKSEIKTSALPLIDQAVAAVFPDEPWSPVAALGGGLSTSTLYQIAVAEQHYVARLTAPEDPHNDLAHEHAVMNVINQLGIAPHLYYADAQSGIAITDFVAGQPLFPWHKERPPLLPLLADLIRTLHHGPTLPRGESIFAKAEVIYGWLPAKVQATEEVMDSITLLREVVPQLTDPAHLRPSHGDINPGNLLFESNRLWLIDWATAGQDNFYFDLTCCTNFFCFRSEEAEMTFLQHYFGRALTAEEADLYAYMRAFCAIYYGLMFLYMSGLQGTPLLTDAEIATLPDYPAFMALLGAGQEAMGNPQSQQRLGFIYLQRALRFGATLPQR